MKIIGVIDLMKGPWLKDSCPDNVALLPFIKAGSNARFVVRTEPGQRQSVMNRVEEAMLKNYNKRAISRIRP